MKNRMTDRALDMMECNTREVKCHKCHMPNTVDVDTNPEDVICEHCES